LIQSTSSQALVLFEELPQRSLMQSDISFNAAPWMNICLKDPLNVMLIWIRYEDFGVNNFDDGSSLLIIFFFSRK